MPGLYTYVRSFPWFRQLQIVWHYPFLAFHILYFSGVTVMHVHLQMYYFATSFKYRFCACSLLLGVVDSTLGRWILKSVCSCVRGECSNVYVMLLHLKVFFTLFTRVGTLIVATIYLQLIQTRYMFRSFTVLHCSHQHCVQPVASDVEVVGYL